MRFSKVNSIIYKITYKLKRIVYLILHPYLWSKKIQINGIPNIQSPENLSLGKNVSINEKVFLQCRGGVRIGENVTLSYGAVVLTEGLNTADYIHVASQVNKEHVYKSVYIGDGVWIGANSTILPGAYIPPYCVIAAGAVVSGTLQEESMLYAGIPAKAIKKLV